MRHYSRDQWTQVFESLLGDPLPGQTPQGVMEESVSQRHYLGARLFEPHSSRIFRYVRADADRQLRAACGVWPLVDYNETGTVAVIATAGARTVTLTAVAAVALDEYAEGLLSFGGGGTSLWGELYRVKGNSAAALGATFTVTLYDALVHALTVADIATLYHSPWKRRVISQRQRQIDGVATDYRLSTVCGVPTRYVQASYYCWIQVKGPCVVLGSSGTEGTANSERAMQFDDVGALVRLRDLGDGLGRHGYAGNILPFTTAGNQPNGLIGIWLDIPGG